MKRNFTLFCALISSAIIQAQTFWTSLNSPTNCSYYAVAHDASKMVASNGSLGWAGERFYLKLGAGAWGTVAVTINSVTSLNNINCLVNGDLLLTGSQGTVPVVYRSTNNGLNWSQSTATLVGFNQNIIQDGSGNVYVYSLGGSAICKSNDNGATFSIPNSTFTAKCLAVSGNTLFAARSGISTWNIYKSTDAGVTWSLTANNLSLTSQSFVYATPNGNVYIDSQRKSTDGGTTWTNMTAPPNSGFYFVDYANNYYVANDPNNVYKSSDAGSTYTDVINGLPLSPTASMQRRIPTNDGKLYVSVAGPNMTYSLFVHPVGGPTSINEINSSGDHINIFPIPASHSLNLEWTGNKNSQYSYQVFDAGMKQVQVHLRDHNGNAEIETSNLNNGLYFLKVNSVKGGASVHKFIVQH